MPTYTCTKSIECLFVVEAESLMQALAQLPSGVDEIIQSAEVMVDASMWSVQEDDGDSPVCEYDEADIQEARDLPFFDR